MEVGCSTLKDNDIRRALLMLSKEPNVPATALPKRLFHNRLVGKVLKTPIASTTLTLDTERGKPPGSCLDINDKTQLVSGLTPPIPVLATVSPEPPVNIIQVAAFACSDEPHWD
ncbi:hypothetical protein D3C85_1514300 [compost metagenome]